MVPSRTHSVTNFPFPFKSGIPLPKIGLFARYSVVSSAAPAHGAEAIGPWRAVSVSVREVRVEVTS